MGELHRIMKLELLPNEILIECFGYLNAFDIFHSFGQLNFCFNSLIRSTPLHLNFQYVTKSIFDEFCTKIILNPKVKNQIYSLHLWDKTASVPVDTFYSLFSIDEFFQLRELKVMLPLKSTRRFLDDSDDPYSYLEIELADLPLSKLRTLSISAIDFSVYHIQETSSIIKLTLTECYFDLLYQLLFKNNFCSSFTWTFLCVKASSCPFLFCLKNRKTKKSLNFGRTFIFCAIIDNNFLKF
jgi:hypothetical protein